MAPDVSEPEAEQPGEQQSQKLFAGLIAAAGGIAVGALALILAIQLAAGYRFDPVQFRIYLWDSPIYFLCLPLAVFSYVLWRILLGSGHLSHPRLRYLGTAVAVALAVVSLSGFQIARPVALNWNATPNSDAEANPFWLPQAVSQTRALGLREQRPVLYYLHADWCHICPDFESYVLGSPFLSEDLAPFYKVRLNVSDTHRWEEYIQHTFGVSGVPALIVRDRRGQIVPRPVVGENISLRAVQSVLQAAARPAAPL